MQNSIKFFKLNKRQSPPAPSAIYSVCGMPIGNNTDVVVPMPVAVRNGSVFLVYVGNTVGGRN